MRHSILFWRLRCTVVLTALVCTAAHGQTTQPEVGVTYDPASAVLEPGQSMAWTIDAPADDKLTYQIKLNNLKVIDQGEVGADHTVRAKLEEPGWLLVQFMKQENGKPHVIRTAGAIVAPQKLAPAAAAPSDFDAFWKAQLADLAKVPPHAVLKPETSDRPGVESFDVTLDNVDGKHVHARLARPMSGKKFPAMVIYQWAGVYGLPIGWATGPASDGWLVLNVLAHDLPIDEPKSFYDQQNAGALKNYVAIGAASRDTSYFRTMFLGDYQAIDYLSHRPDWDGKTLIVRGGSQGGLQSIVIAGLYPKVTGLSVAVPAGCDTLGKEAGRQPGWPYWFAQGAPDERSKVLETSRYFDASNFAPRVHCPAIVCVGLRDTTAPAPGVLGMYNQLQGPKQLIITPDAEHTSPQPRFEQASQAWLVKQRQATSGR